MSAGTRSYPALKSLNQLVIFICMFIVGFSDHRQRRGDTKVAVVTCRLDPRGAEPVAAKEVAEAKGKQDDEPERRSSREEPGEFAAHFKMHEIHHDERRFDGRDD